MQMVVRKKLTPRAICFRQLLHKSLHNQKVNCKMLKGNQIIVLTVERAGRILQEGLILRAKISTSPQMRARNGAPGGG